MKKEKYFRTFLLEVMLGIHRPSTPVQREVMVLCTPWLTERHRAHTGESLDSHVWRANQITTIDLSRGPHRKLDFTITVN